MNDRSVKYLMNRTQLGCLGSTQSYVKLTESILMVHTVLSRNTDTADRQVQLQHNDILLAMNIR